jgi:hypothetical protein
MKPRSIRSFQRQTQRPCTASGPPGSDDAALAERQPSDISAGVDVRVQRVSASSQPIGPPPSTASRRGAVRSPYSVSLK